jgi:hypothetical protein
MVVVRYDLKNGFILSMVQYKWFNYNLRLNVLNKISTTRSWEEAYRYPMIADEQ